MSHLTLVTTATDEAALSLSLLERLLSETRTLFEAGPVIERHFEGSGGPVVLLVAATIHESARHTLLDWFGYGRDTRELLAELWERNLNLDVVTLDAWGQPAFPVFTNNVRDQINGLALSEAITWLIMQLSADSDILRASDWRYEHRQQLEWLRKHPTPTARRRRRRTTQG